MKIFFDFFPIFIFFIAFKFADIYIATAAFIVASCLQMAVYWYQYRRLESMHVITLIAGVLLGGATLWLKNELFIKWKPTIIYWIFALFCIGTQSLGFKPLIQRLLEKNITLPKEIWVRLNLIWSVFFVAMGGANIYVAYHYVTNTWVNFKFFGLLGLTLLFIIAQALYLSRYLKTEEGIR